ncbi:hypothetical protein MRS76_18420 [Rhizobiaceae bacterium n13]|nr:hypothetical protein [Fererhizobium litorale]MDI7863932.1 hypothetical protein [Fererhizobium litorale]
MDQLPPHAQRTRQPVQPGTVGYRHHPLRYPQHCFPLLPLIAKAAGRSAKTAPHGAVFDSWP